MVVVAEASITVAAAAVVMTMTTRTHGHLQTIAQIRTRWHRAKLTSSQIHLTDNTNPSTLRTHTKMNLNTSSNRITQKIRHIDIFGQISDGHGEYQLV